jgi:chromosomal replication initiation ATPase DnaA
VIDDADRADERTLFSAWNEAQVTRQPLLLIAEVAPPAWKITLPDLVSRLSATPTVTLGAPDDDLIGRLLAKQLERRGLDLTLEVRAYLIPRAPRSHHGVIALADALDTASLARRRAVTIPLAREVLGPIDGHGEGG